MLKYHLNESIDMSSRNGKFIKSSLQWIISRFKVGKGVEIADFGCGPGLYTTGLAEQGAVVTGIDFSGNSLRYAKKTARKKGLAINYIKANYLDFNTKDKFDLIIMIMCDYCALSYEQRKTILSKFRSLLKPNGLVALDIYSLNSFDARKETSYYELNQLNGFWSDKDYYCFVNTFKYNKERVILDKYSIIEETGKREIYNWLQYFDESSLKKEFEQSGFIVKELYADVAGGVFAENSAEIAIVAGK
ncbi:MAG: class I SAM-dependent methyltransferase [Deltaproteobacteria bacterium]|nr:class I SAM-dependent methyltransferase [Deltaproteobacteria bacterium]